MRKTIGLFLVAVAIFITIPSDSIAQDRNSITGFIFNESRGPVAEIYVELQNDFYATVGRTRTRGSGMYTFLGIPPGQYYVKVLSGRTGYEEQIKSVSLVPLSVVQGRGVATEQVDFYLKTRKPRAGESGAPGVVFAQAIPPEAQSLYDAGINDLANKNDMVGLDKIKRSLEIFSDYYMALDRLGNEYVNRGFYDVGFVLLTKAVMVNPRSFTSTAGLGVAEYRLGRPDSAVSRFKAAVKMDKSSVNAHLWLGIALHATKNFPEALGALLEANELSGGTIAELHWQLARVYKDQKKYGLAADELDLFLKLKPDAENAEEIRKVITTLRAKQQGDLKPAFDGF